MRSNPFTTTILVPIVALVLAAGPIHRAAAAEPDFAQLADAYVGMARTEKPTPLTEIEKMLSDDFIQSTSLGTVYKGKAANMELYHKSIAEIRTALSQLDASIDVQSVRRSPQTVVLFGKITMSGRVREGDAPFRRELWESMVFSKQGREWLMVQEHSTRAAPPGETVAPAATERARTLHMPEASRLAIVEEVRATTEKMRHASERADIDAILGFLSSREDVSLTHNGTTVFGEEAISELLRPGFTQIRSQRFSPESMRFIVLDPNNVLVVNDRHIRATHDRRNGAS